MKSGQNILRAGLVGLIVLGALGAPHGHLAAPGELVIEAGSDAGAPGLPHLECAQCSRTDRSKLAPTGTELRLAILWVSAARSEAPIFVSRDLRVRGGRSPPLLG